MWLMSPLKEFTSKKLHWNYFINLIYSSFHTTFTCLQLSMSLVMIISISAEVVYMFCQTSWCRPFIFLVLSWCHSFREYIQCVKTGEGSLLETLIAITGKSTPISGGREFLLAMKLMWLWYAHAEGMLRGHTLVILILWGLYHSKSSFGTKWSRTREMPDVFINMVTTVDPEHTICHFLLFQQSSPGAQGCPAPSPSVM